MTYPNQTQSLTPKRVVTLDIETISLTPNPDGALDAKNGRIVCIAMLIENEYRNGLTPAVLCDLDERKILERFWSTITENDLLVGHHILGFDLMFIRQRSWILGIRPPGEKPNAFLNLRKYYTEQVYDLMEIWTNWSSRFKGAGLGDIAEALGVGSKTGHGSEVNQLWANREYVKLMDYCMNDVWLAYQIYCRLNYRDPLGVPLPSFTQPRQERELVLVPSQQKAPAPTANGYPAPVQAVQEVLAGSSTIPSLPQNGHSSGFTPSFEAPKSETKDPIFYHQAGGEVLLSGKGIFRGGIKKTLKDLRWAWGEKVSKPDEKPQRFVWHLRQDKFIDFANLCQKAGVPLQAQGNGTLAVSRG